MLYSIRRLLGLPVVLAVLLPLVTSCQTIWDNDDCGTEYRVKFKYDYNMAFADAFASQVRSVTLYAFNTADGRLAFSRTESGEALAAADYSMALDVDPGQYHLVAWAGLADGDGFSVPRLTEGVSTIDDLTCRINRHPYTLRGQSVDSVGRLQPLWNGYLEAQPLTRGSSFPQQAYVTVPLVKDTHTLRVILQQMAEGDVPASRFEVSVTDDNGLLAADNSLRPDDGTLTYLAYYSAQGAADAGTEGQQLNVAVYELTVGRLMADSQTRLQVTDRIDGHTVLSIPLVQYLELCRTVANYRMPLQEYLDREDTYSLTFFLDANHAWVDTQVIINNWIVRFNDLNP